ncbi:unnamed protein product [Soboliphyme baturini]|uniref:Ima1_N domain-containing protein n=1 Tax=Soboliphyme baturini TaxID=241478 RepID=A0A183IJH6_9BILA|nr:unnamed protein product [Soboliphyme baturini]
MPLQFFLRLKISTSVSCWFCGCSHKVRWRNRNSWVCPSCEQYNGFNKDGNLARSPKCLTDY